MPLSRAVVVVAVIALSCATPPAAAQAVSPNASWSCLFASTPTDCGFYLQAAAPDRATLVVQARDGNNAVELTTEPGDINLFGSGLNERADLELGPSSSYCNQGQEEWWAHSLMFPNTYVVPLAGLIWNWGVVFDFHNTGSTGQANFQIVSLPTGLEFWIAGGASVVNAPTDPGFYRAPIGTVIDNQWYDFVYHVKWSSGTDGFFQAWLNGQQLLNYAGPTLYTGQSCYLKLANYHTPLGLPVSVVHDRLVRGTTLTAVEIPNSSPTLVPVPNVVGQPQSTASTSIINAGLVVGTVTQQQSTAAASGNVLSEAPAAGANVASGSAVNLVVSSSPAQVAVPNVVGETQAAATTAISGAGLGVGSVTQQSSTTVASGQVVSESPAAGTSVASASTVNLVVSTGGSSGGGSGGGGSGGGGGVGALTLCALLGALIVAIAQRRGAPKTTT